MIQLRISWLIEATLNLNSFSSTIYFSIVAKDKAFW